MEPKPSRAGAPGGEEGRLNGLSWRLLFGNYSNSMFFRGVTKKTAVRWNPASMLACHRFRPLRRAELSILSVDNFSGAVARIFRRQKFGATMELCLSL